MKRDTDNRERALESTRGFLHRLKMSWTLVHKRFKIGSEFSPTIRKFCIVLPTRCTRKPNPTKRWIRSLVSEPQQHFKLAMGTRQPAFSGNTSLIATFSSLFFCFLIASIIDGRMQFCGKDVHKQHPLRWHAVRHISELADSNNEMLLECTKRDWLDVPRQWDDWNAVRDRRWHSHWTDDEEELHDCNRQTGRSRASCRRPVLLLVGQSPHLGLELCSRRITDDWIGF